ncbi:TRAP transporter large permease [Desulfobacula sp.]|uniref:TRAP transporter large permease n=1 Tax=Desulfobacula sp. TaxID=2593537 RepID=UPI002631974F|nr:TRAP transporter large permease [Desulfobacula sp.]
MIISFIIIFSLLLCSGMPIFLTLGLTSITMLIFFSHVPAVMVPEVMYNSLGGFTLLAIPFFTVAAQFMTQGGVSRHLINAINCYVGHWRGGLAIACVFTCMFFAAICGSSVATALSIGIIVVPAMAQRGYSLSFATGVVASSGTMGIMIPPSISLILFGIITEQSIPRLFLGGVLPGILEGGLYIAWICYYARRKNYGGSKKVSFKKATSTTLKALPALSLPIIVLGGIYSGIVTVTEAAALAAGAAIIVALFIYREVKFNNILNVFADGMKSAGMIMIIIASASVFGHWITHAGIPAQLVTNVKSLNLQPWMFLLFCNFLFLFLGMFLEVVSIMLITLPILLPTIIELGIDPIHFGVMMVVNMEVALITPPVGLNLFVLSGVANVPLKEVVRGAFPFMLLGLLEIALVTYIPEIVTFLPNLLMGPG